MARTSASAFGLLVALAALAGCSYSVFNDLEDQAPAARVTQESSDISSASFGDQLVGLPRGGGNAGGLVVITGNADPAFATATISGSGGVSAAHLEADDVKSELGNPDRINAMAAVPSSLTAAGAQGPFLYLGSVSLGLGTVRVMDAVTMRHVQAYDAPVQPQVVASFGLSLAAARLGDNGLADDIAVGAKDAVVLLRAASGGTLSWPYMQTDQAVVVAGGTDWPSGELSVIASGDLDPSTDEDEVVAAVPEKNAVVVIHHVADCFANATETCKTHLVIPIPSGASLFGSALLVGDVDDDGAPELVVGAPDVNRVYVYDLGAEHFDLQTPSAPPAPTTITPPTGAREFGAALAFGKVDGGSKPLLVVGAPGTAVSGAATAGRLYLFGSDLKPVGEGVELATPEEKTLLGRRLAVVPFAPSDGGSTYELLAASGRDSVFIFFANLTPAHKDVRK